MGVKSKEKECIDSGVVEKLCAGGCEQSTNSLTDDKRGSISSSSSSSSMDGNGSDKHRGTWTGQLDFLLSCIGYAVGLGNIWRFPYLCYKNGGAAFLIPYAIFAVLCGLPLYMLELSFGQFSSLSPISIWRISPLFKGLGYGMVVISGIVCIYYNIIITWTLYYMFKSFTAILPWATCNNEWNTDACYLRQTIGSVIDKNATNGTDFMAQMSRNFTDGTTISSLINNETDLASEMVNATLQRRTASEEYWLYHVLNISDGIEDLGDIQWELAGCLLLAWVVVFLCLVKGVKSSGRVVYFSATFPYIVLAILLVRGVTLPGAYKGLEFYLLKPNMTRLLDYQVWGDAATQIFYSMGAAWGGLITMASYNKFHNNCYRDALIVPFMNCGTSAFAGVVVFSIIGYMAHITGLEIKDVVEQGPGLAFIVYPEVVTHLPLSPLWAFLFFLMLFTVGLDSQFGMFETMVSAFVDEFPKQLRHRKLKFTIFMCVLLFLLGIPCVTRGGMYVLQLMDWYSAAFSLMLISLCECLVIGYIYGVDRFVVDIESMVRFKPSKFYCFMWKYVTPLVIFCLLAFTIIMHSPVTYGSEADKYEYPWWALLLGWLMALCSLLPLPVVAIHTLIYPPRSRATAKAMAMDSSLWRRMWERVKACAQPAEGWGPALDHHRTEWKQLMHERGVSRVYDVSKEMVPLGGTTTDGISVVRGDDLDV